MKIKCWASFLIITPRFYILIFLPHYLLQLLPAYIPLIASFVCDLWVFLDFAFSGDVRTSSLNLLQFL